MSLMLMLSGVSSELGGMGFARALEGVLSTDISSAILKLSV